MLYTYYYFETFEENTFVVLHKNRENFNMSYTFPYNPNCVHREKPATHIVNILSQKHRPNGGNAVSSAHNY